MPKLTKTYLAFTEPSYIDQIKPHHQQPKLLNLPKIFETFLNKSKSSLTKPKSTKIHLEQTKTLTYSKTIPGPKLTKDN